MIRYLIINSNHFNNFSQLFLVASTLKYLDSCNVKSITVQLDRDQQNCSCIITVQRIHIVTVHSCYIEARNELKKFSVKKKKLYDDLFLHIAYLMSSDSGLFRSYTNNAQGREEKNHTLHCKVVNKSFYFQFAINIHSA